MNIGILTTSKQFLEYAEITRFVEAGTARGHKMTQLIEYNFRCVRNENGISVLYEGKPLEHFDVIINRPTFIEEPSLHAYLNEFLTAIGIRVVNGFPAIAWCKNKLDQHYMFAKVGIPTPDFAITKSPEEAISAAKEIGYPVIVKLPFGTHGVGVFLADKPETLKPIVSYLTIRDGNPIIIEEFIEEAGHQDIRAFVLGGKVIASMLRTAPKGDIRSNISKGGIGSIIELTNEERELAIHVADIFKLEISGVDIIRSKRGPLILEINSNPGFKGLEAATGFDVAGTIIDYLEKTSKKMN